MKIKVLGEEGLDHALRGMAYSYKDRALDPDTWWEGQREKALKRAGILSQRGGGHNKFLESIVVWIDLEAARCVWSEFDTYRVGTTKQSESTMHTLAKRAPTADDFEPETSPLMVEAFIQRWNQWKAENGAITQLKCDLPEGFLQRRVVCTNYKVIQNIIAQRWDHRLQYWPEICKELAKQLQHPEWVDRQLYEANKQS